jgi:type II secretory pathway component PulJ
MMRRHYNAYTLLELMMYLALLSVQMLFLFIVMGSATKRISLVAHERSDYVKRTLAFDVLRRDIWSACPSACAWDEDEGVFLQRILVTHHKEEQRYVGWYCKNATLFRKEGIYDRQTRRWVSKKKSCMLKRVKRFKITPFKQGTSAIITSAAVTYCVQGSDGKENERTFYVELKNASFSS